MMPGPGGICIPRGYRLSVVVIGRMAIRNQFSCIFANCEPLQAELVTGFGWKTLPQTPDNTCPCGEHVPVGKRI